MICLLKSIELNSPSCDEEHRMMIIEVRVQRRDLIGRFQRWNQNKLSKYFFSNGNEKNLINSRQINSMSTLAQAETLSLNTSLIWTNSFCKLRLFYNESIGSKCTEKNIFTVVEWWDFFVWKMKFSPLIASSSLRFDCLLSFLLHLLKKNSIETDRIWQNEEVQKFFSSDCRYRNSSSDCWNDAETELFQNVDDEKTVRRKSMKFSAFSPMIHCRKTKKISSSQIFSNSSIKLRDRWSSFKMKFQRFSLHFRRSSLKIDKMRTVVDRSRLLPKRNELCLNEEKKQEQSTP